MQKFNMIKGIQTAYLLLLLWNPVAGILFNRRRHPIPFYPGLRERHGGNFYSGPHNQRRQILQEYREPHRVIFPNPNSHLADLYPASSFHTLSVKRPEGLIFKEDNRIKNDQARRPGYRFRRPNHARRRPFKINKRRRPYYRRKPIFEEKPIAYPFNHRPPIVIYEGSRPPVLSYNRPSGSRFHHNRFHKLVNKEFPIKESSVHPKGFFVKPLQDQEASRKPSKDIVLASEESKKVLDQSTSRFPVSTATITEGNHRISDNSGGWIPISSSSQSYFTGEIGKHVQEYKEPATDYGVEGDSALYKNTKFDYNYDETGNKNENQVKSNDFSYYGALGDKLPSQKNGHDLNYGKFSGMPVKEASSSIVSGGEDAGSKLADKPYPDNNGYEDPTGHGEKLASNSLDRIVNNDVSAYTVQPNYVADIKDEPLSTLGQNYKVTVTSSYGYSDLEPVSYSNYETKVRPGVYEILPLRSNPIFSASKVKSKLRLRSPASSVTPPDDGFSKQIPEDRDSFEKDEAIVLVGAKIGQSSEPSVTPSVAPVQGPRDYYHFQNFNERNIPE